MADWLHLLVCLWLNHISINKPTLSVSRSHLQSWKKAVYDESTIYMSVAILERCCRARAMTYERG